MAQRKSRVKSAAGQIKTPESFAEKAAKLHGTQTEETSPVEQVTKQATPIAEDTSINQIQHAPQPPQNTNPEPKAYKAVVSGRITNIEKKSKHLQLPVPLQEKIAKNISGNDISVYVALVEMGYKAMMMQAAQSGGLAHIVIEDVLNEYRTQAN